MPSVAAPNVKPDCPGVANKNLDDVEEIFIEAYTKRYNQYKTYSEYITKIQSYKALPSEGNFIKFFTKYGFNQILFQIMNFFLYKQLFVMVKNRLVEPKMNL